MPEVSDARSTILNLLDKIASGAPLNSREALDLRETNRTMEARIRFMLGALAQYRMSRIGVLQESLQRVEEACEDELDAGNLEPHELLGLASHYRQSIAESIRSASVLLEAGGDRLAKAGEDASTLLREVGAASAESLQSVDRGTRARIRRLGEIIQDTLEHAEGESTDEHPGD